MKYTLLFVVALQGLASAASIPWPPNTTHSGEPPYRWPQPPVTLNPTAINVTDLNEPVSIDFHACPGYDLSNNVFDIKEITIDPKPIKKQALYHVVTRGNLKQTLGEGANVSITYIVGTHEYKFDYDFCKGVSAGCPAEPGALEWGTGQHISGLVRNLLTLVTVNTARGLSLI